VRAVPSRGRVVRGLVALVVVAAGLAGCSGVPDSGDPIPVPNRKLEAFPAVNADLVGPRPDTSAAEVIDLLLNAARSTQSRERLGEKFLTSRAEDALKRPDVLLCRLNKPMVVSESETTAVVKLTGTVLGTVSDVGVYKPLKQSLNTTVSLVRRGVWQIDSALPGVLVRETDFVEAFRPVPLYFAGLGGDDAADVLVPELRFMDRSLTDAALLTPIVRALLRGPSPWLAPVTRDPLPRNTTLRSNVTLHDLNNDVVVDLSPDIESAKPADLKAFAAQVAWSLDPYFQRDVRLQVNGQPLDVPDVDAVQGPEHWSQYNAAGGPSQSLYYISKGALHRYAERADASETVLGGDAARSGVVAAAVAADEGGVALVKQAAANRQTLWIGAADGAVNATVSGRVLSRPTWGYGHDAVLVAVDGQLRQVDQAQRVLRVKVSHPSPIGPIRAIRLAPEGARLALVAGVGADTKAYVGLFQPAVDDGAPVLRDLREVPVSIAQVQDIGWSEATPATVAVAGQGADGSALMREVSVDGVVASDSNRTGLPPGPLSLATSARIGTVPFVESGKQLYQGGLRTWSRLPEVGDARAPFYPG